MKWIQRLGGAIMVMWAVSCTGLENTVRIVDQTPPVGQAVSQAEQSNNQGTLVATDVVSPPVETPFSGGATPIRELGTAEADSVTTAQVTINNTYYLIDLAGGWLLNGGVITTPDGFITLNFAPVLVTAAGGDTQSMIQSVAGQSAVVQEQSVNDVSVWQAQAGTSTTYYIMVGDQLIAVSPLTSDTNQLEAQQQNILTMIASLRPV